MISLETIAVSQQVRDRCGDVWTRNEYGWSCGIVQASSEWLDRYYRPLTLLEPKS